MNVNHHPTQREDDGTRQDSSVLGINKSQQKSVLQSYFSIIKLNMLTSSYYLHYKTFLPRWRKI